MRWGFDWALGPFQTWDALASPAWPPRLEEEGARPAAVREVLERATGASTATDGARAVFLPATGEYAPVPPRRRATSRPRRCGGRAPPVENRSASLLDMGDGVALLEYHGKLNIIDEEIMALTREALERGARDYRALVIGNDAPDFSAGANLALMVMASRMRQWAQVERVVKAPAGR